MTLPSISSTQSGQVQPPRSTQPTNVSEEPAPRPLCGEPRTVPVHDDVIQLCYDVTVYCGVTAEQAAERYRRFLQARNLSDNVASRLHRQPAPPVPSNPAPAPSESETGAADVVRGVLEFLLALTPLGWSGCSSDYPDVPIEIPDASNPPPNEDPACSSRRSQIQDNDPLRSTRTPGGDAGVSVLSELQRQFPGIALPILNVTYDGHPIWQDSAGNSVTEIETNNPVSFVRVDNRLYVLTANNVGGAFAPSTLLVYDVSSMPPRPVSTDDISTDSRGGPSNAIVLGHYNPVAMATMVGHNEIGILFGDPSGGVVSTIDPFSNRIIESDWCSTHGALDGGMSVMDAGTDVSDSGSNVGDSGRDASDAGSDAEADARDGG